MLAPNTGPANATDHRADGQVEFRADHQQGRTEREDAELRRGRHEVDEAGQVEHRRVGSDEEMPNGLNLGFFAVELAFGMNTLLIGSGRCSSFLSASASSPSHRCTPYASTSSKSWPSTPGAPLLERHWAQARARMSSRMILSYSA
jgi:hypothetical protein